MSTRRSSAHSLATRSLELSMAAPLVVAHRMHRMLAAAPNPTAKDWKEFTRMHSEKSLAFYQSWVAIWSQLGAMQIEAWRSIWLVRSWLPASPRRSARRLHARQGAAAARVINAALAPVHSKAVANAKRLSRR